MTTAMRRWAAVENQSDSSQCAKLAGLLCPHSCAVPYRGTCTLRGPQAVTLEVQEVSEQPDHQEPQDSSPEN